MSNYSFYALPVAWIIAFLPHIYAAQLSNLYDNCSPRTYPELVEKDQTLDKATKARILRTEGAHTNGFENLPLFASAVLAGNLAGLDPSTLNKVCGSYLVSRVMYNLIYINNTTSETGAKMRGLVFYAGVGHIFALWIMAGNVFRGRL